MPRIKVPPRGLLEKLEVEDMIQKAGTTRDKCLVVIWYLTGFRISEIINLRKDIELKIYFDDEDIQVLELEHKPLKKRNRSGIIESHKIFLELQELPYNNYIVRHYKDVAKMSRLFPFTRIRAYQIIKKLNSKVWPHLARHTRATHLADQLDINDLMTFFGWASANQAMKYVKRKPIRGVKLR